MLDFFSLSFSFLDGDDIIYTNWRETGFLDLEKDYLMIELDTGKWADEDSFAKLVTLCQKGKAH